MSTRSKKKPGLSIAAKNSMLSLTLVLLFTAFSFALFKICNDRMSQFESKLAELDEVKGQLVSLELHNERLRDKVKLLKTDEGVEEVAREKLGLIRPGELAYSVVPPPPPQFSTTDDLNVRYGPKEIKEVDKDRGTVIRVLRHLFGPKAQQVST